MRRFEEDARFARLQSLFQCLITAGSVRVEQVSGSFQRVGQDRTDPVVAVPCAADVGPDRVDRLAVQIQHAHELLGSPTSIALASVATDGRGV